MATFTGGTGNDVVTASAGAINDTLTGLAGNDTLTGLGGADLLDGGTGIDTANYSSSTVAVNANLTTLSGTGGDAQGVKATKAAAGNPLRKGKGGHHGFL